MLPLLLAVALLVFGTNLQGVILPILGHERGAGMLSIGLYSSGWSAGFVLACLLVGQMLGRLGHAAAFMWLALASAAASALLFAFPHDVAWIGLRVVIGFCFGGLAAIIEGWLVECAGSGPAFAAYMVTNLLASLAGTLSLDLIDPTGPAPFVLTGCAVALSAGVVALGRIPRPVAQPIFRPRLVTLIRRTPLAALGCVAAGLVTGAIGGLAPVFGMMASMDMGGDTLMLAANSLGGAIATAPMGWLVERFGRRRVLGAILPFGLVICVPFILDDHLSRPALILLLGAFGLVQYPIYGLSVGIANADMPDRPATHIAGELVLLFGLGTIIGPLVGAELLSNGLPTLFAFLALVLATLLVALPFIGRSRSSDPAC
jgi:MFS family permease